jgi:hypothetical protein
VADWQQKVARETQEAKARDVLKPERHSHHQVEQCEMLPQRIADWVCGGIAVSIYYM